MRLFKKKEKPIDDEEREKLSDKVAGKIAGTGIKMQKIFADKMNKIFMNTGNKKTKTILIAFCITAGGYSIYLLTNAIISPAKKQESFKIDQVKTPQHFSKSGEESILPDAYVDEQTYNKIQEFKKYMDSLHQNKKVEYDSILQARPGLMDSVQMLEEIYYSQKQK